MRTSTRRQATAHSHSRHPGSDEDPLLRDVEGHTAGPNGSRASRWPPSYALKVGLRNGVDADDYVVGMRNRSNKNETSPRGPKGLRVRTSVTAGIAPLAFSKGFKKT